jgi:hypothetical protein
MRRILQCGAAAISLLAPEAGRALPPAPAWAGYAGNAQHTAPAPAAGQALGRKRWSTPVDLQPQRTGNELFIHYAAPMITNANTVLLAVKTGATGGWQMEAHAGATGKRLWTDTSDYVTPTTSGWTPSYPAALGPQKRLFFAGAGGTVLYRDTPDKTTGASGRLAFYGLANWSQYSAQLTQTVMIDTPITSDARGDIYFGFVVTGSNPLQLQSGIARIGVGGKMKWVSASQAAGDKAITQVAMNCAPAISADGKSIYIAVSNGTAGSLLKLNAASLVTEAKMALTDPASGQPAWINDQSSASPTIGPDGDVYYGVLENPFPQHDDRGWLLHFDVALATLKTPGSFGWDDTVSIVPTSAIPSYTGNATYLLMTKYNNYVGLGPLGDGQNKIAILDPRATQNDEYSQTAVTVMREVQTMLGAPGSPEGGLYEWCINSAVVDAHTGAVFAGSENGQFYRWDLAANTLSQNLKLNAPRPEAYTPSLVGPDGTVYAINNATLYAIGN